MVIRLNAKHESIECNVTNPHKPNRYTVISIHLRKNKIGGFLILSGITCESSYFFKHWIDLNLGSSVHQETI